ncbi:UNVERIFIED_CONTAM: hypothetical protein Sradi_3007500 [Sesamum radiatum]|uniref:Uncharacterized protein n=1 Tax=Sesamum radiatum TaxID=300843 RepID=A0AAW2S137_SESRA
MIKSLHKAIATYSMSCFKLLETFLEEVEGLLAAFFWKQEAGKTIHWLVWSKVCRSKKEGVLGMRCLKEFNVALLCKQAWRVSTATDSLVHRLFKARYLSETMLIQAMGKESISYAWRSILSAKPLLQTGCRWRIRDGSSI